MESSVLVKTFAILETLSAAKQAMTLAGVSEQCGLAKPTAHRVLNDLSTMGYVERVDTGMYRLSEKFFRLASGTGQEQLVIEAWPVLQDLHEETDETVNLGVLRRDRVVYLRVIESTHPLRRVVEPGSVDPFHSTALGRAIASQLPERSWERLLAHANVESRTEGTHTDRAEIQRLLIKARKDGYAVEIDENDIGVMCIGSPVFDNSGVIAAVSLSVPSARTDAERRKSLIEAVRLSAQRLTESLKTSK